MREVTHQSIDGRLVQIVSPQKLRAILRKDGSSMKRPKYFKPEDQWLLPKRR